MTTRTITVEARYTLTQISDALNSELDDTEGGNDLVADVLDRLAALPAEPAGAGLRPDDPGIQTANPDGTASIRPTPGLRAAIVDVLNLKHNAFDKQGFPCQCKTHERARAALAAAPSAPAGLDVERLARAVVSEFPHITLSGRDMPAAWAAIAAAYESDG